VAKSRYRSVFVSDAHLGFRGAQASKLLTFLKHIDCDHLYFVGDTFDLWSLQRRFFWTDDVNNILRRVIKMAKQGVNITVIAGNHDEPLRQFIPCEFGQIHVRESVVHETSTGEKFLVIHGDQFDFVTSHLKWLAKLGSVVYDWLLWWNHYLTVVRTRLGLPYWSFAAWAKSRAKRAVGVIRDFEQAAMEHADRNGCVGVICGHIHTPKMYTENGITYANCGDWVESCSALVEMDDGEMKIVYPA
jgi:UDP-2,3-diacylglucosamine pyrophosphatase LpxH